MATEEVRKELPFQQGGDALLGMFLLLGLDLVSFLLWLQNTLTQIRREERICFSSKFQIIVHSYREVYSSQEGRDRRLQDIHEVIHTHIQQLVLSSVSPLLNSLRTSA